MKESNGGHVYIEWEEAFIGLAKLAALKSKVLDDQRGCVIVDENNCIMSIGFNGVPAGCNDEYFLSPERRDYCILPAAIGAIISARRNLQKCSIYMTNYPDCEETKMIIQAGIKEIKYINVDVNDDNYRSSSRMLNATSKIATQIDDISVNCMNKQVLTWNEFYIGSGKLLAMRSKDPNTQVGCSISDDKHRIISIGYNGLPFGCKDEDCPWNCRKAELLSDTKYPYSTHSETNGIIIPQNNNISVEGSYIYVTLFPCNDCTMKLIQAGIKRIHYVSDKYVDTTAVILAKEMLEDAKIDYVKVPDVEVTLESRGRVLKK